MSNNSYNQSEFLFDSIGDNLILPEPIIEFADGTNWSQSDIQILKEFCKKHKITKFHCGHMSPIAALTYLKDQIEIKSNIISNTKNKVILHG